MIWIIKKLTISLVAVVVSPAMAITLSILVVVRDLSPCRKNRSDLDWLIIIFLKAIASVLGVSLSLPYPRLESTQAQITKAILMPRRLQ